ncbi:MAG: tRNA (cytidine(34)-2'-O)-methyltransferase [Rhodobacteraceae bacterium]|nr:tRNA (cytidine(34)-2'-O)-methyltransferase [Paracoccaceae bacterium]
MRLAVYQPDIAPNLGAMIRICACFGVPLDVIEPCGFPLSQKALKRAAMDYADSADLSRHDSWPAYLALARPPRLVLLTTKAATPLWQFRFRAGDTLLMGRESAGVPVEVQQACDAAVAIPMPGGGRSLNVAVAAGIALAEALRQTT